MHRFCRAFAERPRESPKRAPSELQENPRVFKKDSRPTKEHQENPKRADSIKTVIVFYKKVPACTKRIDSIRHTRPTLSDAMKSPEESPGEPQEREASRE
jgi:hypothetical protein